MCKKAVEPAGGDNLLIHNSLPARQIRGMRFERNVKK